MDESLKKLTWDDLRHWAGSKILERGKAYIKNVYELSLTESGGLIAWVSGREDYATLVEPGQDGEPECFCSCPYEWGPCKHAVAIILAGIEQIKAGKESPLVDKDGELYLTFLDDTAEDDGDDFQYAEDEEEKVKAGRAVPSESRGKKSTLITILEKKNKDELLSLLLDFADRHPEVKRKILEDDQLRSGKIDKLAAALRREIRTVTREEAWYNHWNGEGNRPDYSHIKEQLAALCKQGHADLVVDLGRELWQGGNAQVEQSHDDGDTACEIGECMEVVFQAVKDSTLSRPAQLLWMIDILLEDQFSICDSCVQLIRSRAYGKEDWAEVAANLQARLNSMPVPRSDDYSGKYLRKGVMNWLVDAFERSGQRSKIISLLEQEAGATQCYERLVDTFLRDGNHEKAREWCIKGFQKTLETSPGIAAGLQTKLRELAREEKKFDLAAAYLAQNFFDHPSTATYSELRKAAEKIDCWPAVRAAALAFLESGQRPDIPGRKGDGPPWPLPAPEIAAKPDKRFRRDYPNLNALIEIGILEKRLDDVVTLYQAQQKNLRWGIGKGKEVAAAVAATHPDVALAIWKQVAEGQIKLVKPKAYEEAAVYLRKMRKVYQQTNRLEQWQVLIRNLRTEHRAKRRLLEVLDSLEGKRIID